MAYSCIPSVQSSFTPNTSIVNHHKLRPLSLPFKSLSPWVLRSNNVTQKILGSLKAYDVDFDGFDTPPKGRIGIWSIRDDLDIPSSPYFPVRGDDEDDEDGEDGEDYEDYEDDEPEGPPLMVAERFHSTISQLFQYRIIRCGGPVDDDMANIIVTQLLYLDAIDPTKDIVMYVNSPGGSVTAGMAIFDTMKHIRPDVSTVCVGLAASMGAFLLAAGTKGKRYSVPNSRIMIHQPVGDGGEDDEGDLFDIRILDDEVAHHRQNLTAYLAYFTGQDFDTIDEDTQLDFFMSAKEALDYGLIDSVITNPLIALQSLTGATADQTS